MREFIDKAKDTIKDAEDQMAEGAKKAVAQVEKLGGKAKDALVDVKEDVKGTYEKVKEDLKK
jgi:ElaB/YqjD/DUF883 family membrane-anchored ribosome-binding protein